VLTCEYNERVVPWIQLSHGTDNNNRLKFGPVFQLKHLGNFLVDSVELSFPGRNRFDKIMGSFTPCFSRKKIFLKEQKFLLWSVYYAHQNRTIYDIRVTIAVELM
jgi:hypothetical protein